MAASGDLDVSFLTWLFGGIAAAMTTLGLGLLGLSHGMNSKAIDTAKQTDKDGRDDIWKQIGILADARVEMERRLADYPKREDLRNMRDEVKETVRELRDDLDTNLDKTLQALDRRMADNLRLQLGEQQRSTIDMVRAIVENRPPLKPPS